jgi:predicted transposase YbfD/YdcC
MKRQGATPKGLERRLRDAKLGGVSEPRNIKQVKHPLKALLSALVAAMATMAGSLRRAEERTDQMVRKLGKWMGILKRIPDNVFGKVLPRLRVRELAGRLHCMVKGEHRRGNLKPTVLPVGTVAIDGKNVATLRWHDICRVLKIEDRTTADRQQVKALLSKRFPNVQFCIPDQGEPYALARVHTVTLISSDAAQCVHQRPIEGRTNEIGAMPEVLKEVHATYKRTGLIRMVTTDAGNTSLKVAGQIKGYRWDYHMQIKSEHGELYKEAVRVLGSKAMEVADWSETDKQNGEVMTYHVWQYDLTEDGWLDWNHARQIVRVQRIGEHPETGKRSVGNRYYVSSRTMAQLGPKACLRISRNHWRCENETHWSTDVILNEDRRRLAWSRHPKGVFVVSVLRMMALNIMAVARRLSRMAYSRETPTWRQVGQHFMLVLCESTLDTEAFDIARA